MTTADCHPTSTVPGTSRLFAEFCAGEERARRFYGMPAEWMNAPARPKHAGELAELLAGQNPDAAPDAAREQAIAALKGGAGVVVTGQQVGLFGGPMYTALKAATALARARQATASGKPHVAIFWLATEDHDFAEIDHVTFPARRELRKLKYERAEEIARPVGGVVLDEAIAPLLEQARELAGHSEAMDALAAAYKPGKTFARAFAEFYGKVFAAQGLLVLDAGGRAAHRMGARVLRAGLERADELHATLVERNAALVAAGYHAQVAVGADSSLLFLMDEKTGARVGLKRTRATAAEPKGAWMAGRTSYSTEELVAILEAEPERISPSALLRPVFQDELLGTSLTIGGPAEIAYFAQSAVLFERILGRMTPAEPRLSATLVEPAVAELLVRYDLEPERVFGETVDSLAQRLGARAMPVEGKRKLAAAGQALNAELEPLLEWMRALDAGLGRSGATAASKMRYQMNRLRRLAANFQLEKEESLNRHAEAICHAIYPDGALQERVHAAAYYFGLYGLELAETLTERAAESCAGHQVVWL